MTNSVTPAPELTGIALAAWTLAIEALQPAEEIGAVHGPADYIDLMDSIASGVRENQPAIGEADDEDIFGNVLRAMHTAEREPSYALLRRHIALECEQRAINCTEAAANPDDVMCSACNGSGEGMHDGTTCGSCNGKGVERNREAEAEADARRAEWEESRAEDRAADALADMQHYMTVG